MKRGEGRFGERPQVGELCFLYKLLCALAIVNRINIHKVY